MIVAPGAPPYETAVAIRVHRQSPSIGLERESPISASSPAVAGSSPTLTISVSVKQMAGIATAGQTGVYYDERGHPMVGSALARDPKFQVRVVAETRALLAKPSLR